MPDHSSLAGVIDPDDQFGMTVSGQCSNGFYSGSVYGKVPVQGHGLVDRENTTLQWYFRARGDSWRLSVGTGTDEYYVDVESWAWQEKYGNWPDAGWMVSSVAAMCIGKALSVYLEHKPPNIKPEDFND